MSENAKDINILVKILSAATYQKMKLEDMTPAPYNPRTDLQPEDDEYQQIRDSIINHGLLQPIVYNKRTGNVAGGNQRRKILMDGGVEECTCAVIDVSLQQEKRINLALNKIGNMWDQPKLREIFEKLEAEDYDLSKTSFKDNEVAKLMMNMEASVDSFFQDDEEEDEPKQKAVRQYKCPFCGEVFTK